MAASQLLFFPKFPSPPLHPPPKPTASFARIPPPSGGGRIAPAEQPSCTRCVQPPPRCARGGLSPRAPRSIFAPTSPPPTANCWQWWEWEGGWGLRCRVEKRDAATPPPLIALLKDFSLNFLKKMRRKRRAGRREGGAAAGSCMATPPHHLPPLIASVPPLAKPIGGCIPPLLCKGGRFPPPPRKGRAPHHYVVGNPYRWGEGGDASRALRARTHWRSQWRGGASPPDPPPPPPPPSPPYYAYSRWRGRACIPPPLRGGVGGKGARGDARGRCAPPLGLLSLRSKDWTMGGAGGGTARGGAASPPAWFFSVAGRRLEAKNHKNKEVSFIQYIEIYWTNETCCAGRRGAAAFAARRPPRLLC
nr:hypothetical protein [Morchella crassipes]